MTALSDDQILRIPKAELHVHIEGTVTPDTARELARKNKVTLPDDIFSPQDQNSYAWKDFADCVTRVYDAVAATICCKEDFQKVTYDYLKRCSDENAIYVELIASPNHCGRVGISYADMIGGMAEGIDAARRDTGIEARINATLVRHLPLHEVEKDAQTIVNNPHPYVTGLNLAGAEKEGDILQFKDIFDWVAAGNKNILGNNPHAAENAGPKNLRDALLLKPARIGHGVRIIEDASLVKQFAAGGPVLEICPTSNVLAGIFPSYEAHPLKTLVDAGCRVTLNSDDPGLFNCSIGGEYLIAHKQFGLSAAQLLGITKTAVEAAFVQDSIKDKLRARLALY